MSVTRQAPCGAPTIPQGPACLCGWSESCAICRPKPRSGRRYSWRQYAASVRIDPRKLDNGPLNMMLKRHLAAIRGSSCHIAGPCGCGLPKGLGVRA